MTKTLKTLSIVVPVYFNEESLQPLFDELKLLESALDERGLRLELILINDGSRDKSLERLLEIKRARPATKVISLSRNFGAVAASKVGLRYVTGDAFTILAADLQDPPEQILTMVREWLNGAKLVVSRRATRDDPLPSRLLASVYYRIVDWLVIKNYPQGGFDLMVMDKAMLPTMAHSPKHTNPNLYAFWHGYDPVILEYHRRARRFGSSRWTLRKKIGFMVDSVTSFTAMPLRLMSAFGLIVAALSLVYGAVITVNALLGRVDIRGFATLVVLISFFSGVILVMLGLIGEYLWRIFETVNAKPEAIVEAEFL